MENDMEMSAEQTLNYIMLGRIYDVLMQIAKDTNAEEAQKLFEQHQKGNMLCPTPTLAR